MGSNWGKCLRQKQPVALEASALPGPPGGREKEDRSIALPCHSQGEAVL